MAQQSDEQPGDPVVAAIERVLKVERDGVKTLRDSEDAARRLLADARAQAANITQRTDVRISRLHAAYLQKVERDIAALAVNQPSADESAGYDRATLQAAARRVAARLTGGA
jgi:vacuolar-type H+-ATPase subunit H